MDATKTYGDIFQFLFDLCPPYRFASPWSLLQPDDDARGVVWDARQTLAVLRRKFADRALQRAGVLDIGPGGEYRLAPELVNPTGAVVALRGGPGRPPYGLLTARGCLPPRLLPVRAALKDHWTRSQMDPGQVLFASWRIAEVALLRALGLPATLALGAVRPEHRRLLYLDRRFDVQHVRVNWKPPPGYPVDDPENPPIPDDQKASPAPPAGQPASPGSPSAGAGAGRPRAARPSLALVGWSPRTASARPPRTLDLAATHLLEAWRHLGFDFHGLEVWRPQPNDIANLQYRLRLGALRPVRELVQELAGEFLESIHQFAAHSAAPSVPAGRQPEFVVARADLLAALAGGKSRGDGRPSLAEASRAYDAVLQRDLIEPLLAWALGSEDPVVRNAGVDLATAAELLHRMGLSLHGLQRREMERAATLGVAPELVGALAPYSKLLAHFSSLITTLSHWRRA